jgi:hypothetical protein
LGRRLRFSSPAGALVGTGELPCNAAGMTALATRSEAMVFLNRSVFFIRGAEIDKLRF